MSYFQLIDINTIVRLRFVGGLQRYTTVTVNYIFGRKTLLCQKSMLSVKF